MAEEIQTTLDEMVPALKDLQDRSIFTVDEIHQIVDRRRNSEYDVRRQNNARKADFLRYIKAEMDLEALRKLRTKKIRDEQERLDQQSYQEKDSNGMPNSNMKLGDRHIVQHIHALWRRTLNKYGKSDVGLYLQYAEFCKQIQAHGSFSRILAEALQLFPREEGLWIEASSHEFFVLGSIQNARILMQQGLRIIPHSNDLWMQLFCLELHLVERIKARKVILEGKDKNGEIVENKDEESTNNTDPHKIARMVYRNAIEAVPKNVTFRLKFWDQARLFSDTEDLQRHIVDSIRNDLCKDNAEAWMAWALFQWEQKQKNRTGRKDEENAEVDEDEEIDRSNSDVEQEDDQDILEDGKGDQEQKKRSVNSEDNIDAEGPATKKKKVDLESRHAVQKNGFSVINILRQATQALHTEEMYLKAVRMIIRYIANLQELDNDDDEDPDVATGLEMLETLFNEAAKSDFFSSELVMEQALFLTRLQRKRESVQCLELFTENYAVNDALKVWIHLAEISEKGPVSVLTKALDKADMNHPSYYEILLHLIGAKIQTKDDTDLMSLFNKVVLLTPGFLPINEIEEPIFGVPHALDACLQFLQYLNDKADTEHARKVYRTVIFESSLGKIFSDFDEDSMVNFVEEAAKTENIAVKEDKDRNSKRKNLIRIYDEASKLFDNSALGSQYQERVREVKLSGSTLEETLDFKAQISMDYSKMEPNPCSVFEDMFERYQVVHLRKRINKSSSWMLDLESLFESLKVEDKNSWCVETPGWGDDNEASPSEFLASSSTGLRGYCSFLVQKDTQAYNRTLGQLPLQIPIPEICWHYTPAALWFFVGRNPPDSLSLRGRPEHTDSISNDGTWHLQVSGRKIWFLRPSSQLIDHLKQNNIGHDVNETTRIQVNCHEGDILCINTRLWFHSTVIPAQSGESISYARDFYRRPPDDFVVDEATCENTNNGMTNLEGLFATNDIEEGTIVFTEKDMPNCELHRSSNDPNCEVVELEDGTSGLVSIRAIAAGEFFCVAESDAEGDDSDQNEE